MTTDFDKLYRGVSRAAWAYLFLYFDINIGAVSLLPKFAAYLLFWSAIGLLESEERDLALLRPLCLLLGLWEGADWLLSWTGRGMEGLLYPLDLVVAVAGLYFQFQLFTDFARLAVRWQGEGDTLDRQLLRLRTAQVVLSTVMSVAMVFSRTLWDPASWVYVVLAIAGLAVDLLLMAALFSLRKCFASPSGPPPRRDGASF